MKIRVIGPGCPNCEKLHDMVKKVNDENDIGAEVEYSKDANELIELGVMGSPALLIDGEVAKVGMPSENELLELIKGASE
ncbi:MAG: thioredoxin family protein [Candidatus Woesearchaeota archaeon]